MTDHDPRAADVEMFGQNAVDVASRIAAYIATNPDAANWSPQRWAYEAVMVILNDQGAAHDVLRCMVGQAAYDLAVIHVGSVPPWMEQPKVQGAQGYGLTDRPWVTLGGCYVQSNNPEGVAPIEHARPLYAIREAE